MDLPTLHRVRSLAVFLVGVLIAGLTLTASIPAAHAADGTLSGTVTEAGTGVPLQGVSVQVFCWQVAGATAGDLCAETQTAPNGTYSLSLPPGVYKVSFDHFPTHGRQFYGGGTTLGDANSLEVVVPDGGTATGIGAALKPLRIVSGTVTGNGGQVGGINVTAYQLSSGPSPTWVSVDGVVTAPDGTYALHLTDGTYRVGFSDAHGPYRTEFFDDAGTIEQADDVIVAGSAVGQVNADLGVNHAITGGVTVDGINMPNVTVTAYQADASSPTGWTAGKHTATGDDGRYTLYLPDGTYRIHFQTFQARFDPVFYPGVDSVDAAADVVLAGTDVPDISVAISSGEIDTGPAITGTATVSGTGDPAGGVVVTAYRWNVQGAFWAQVRQRSTAPDGTYALYVPEGTYRIGFRDAAGRYTPVFYDGVDTVEEADDVVQTGGGVTGIDVQLIENHSISGTITADPLPYLPPGAPPTAVTAWRWNAVSLAWERVNTAYSLDGHYVLYIPDGTYRIEFTDVFGAYQHPHFYGGSDNVGEATDVVVAGADVMNIDAHLVAADTEPPPRWSPPNELSAAGQDGWSPQVAVGPDGTAIAVWFRRDGSHSRVQASIRPAHASWSSPTALSGAGQDAFDPQVAIGADGGAVAVWRQWDGTRYRVQATIRAPAGSWSAPATLSGAGADAWDPQVVAGDKGAAVVVWEQTQGGVSQVQASTRGSKGSWSSPVPLSTGSSDARDPQVAMGSNGTAVAVWSRSDGTVYRVQAATRGGNGSWSSPVNLSGAGADAENPQVAVGSDGSATAVWRGWDGSNERVQTASRSTGGVWSASSSLSPAGRDAHDPQVSVDADGMTTAVWARWDGSSDRVQASSRARSGTWSAAKTLSMGGADASAPQVTAGTDGRATALWHESADGAELVRAAIRRPDGSWSVPSDLTFSGPPASHPQVASGSDGTVAAVWERRVGQEDQVQGVVRFDPGGPNHCQNEFGVDLNFLFGVPEEIVDGVCGTVSVRSRWRPLTLWQMNTVFDTVPPGYVPAGATPLEDLVARLEAVKVVVDPGTKHPKTVVFSPAAALRTDHTLQDFVPFEFGYPMAATLPVMASLTAGEHRVQVIWRLSSQHCDGFGDVAAYNCLASGDQSMGTRSFTVGSP